MDNDQMKECIKICWECHHTCQKILFTYCLIKGGKHVKSEHVKIMTDCIQICQLTADFMTRNSELYKVICKTCAKICEICAKSCENIDGEEMKECARICSNCAENCLEMSGLK